jgi:hypothetical protein
MNIITRHGRALLSVAAALAAGLIFLTGCVDSGTGPDNRGNDTVPGRPTGLTVTLTSTKLQASWNPVPGATGYVIVISASSTFEEELTASELCSGTSYTENFTSADIPAGTTLYFSVVAYNAIGLGEPSNIVSKTVPGGSVTYSLDGVWSDAGCIVNINGGNGYITQTTPNGWPLWFQDAYNKNYITVGTQHFRNLTKTGDLTWTGQRLATITPNSAPNTATGITMVSTTIIMDANGKTFREYDNGQVIDIWTRQ